MLRYTLVCGEGHEFEAWFRDSAGFEDQSRLGLIACAICHGTDVRKAIMAPNVARRDRPGQPGTSGQATTAAIQGQGGAALSSQAVPEADESALLISGPEKAMRSALKALRRHVETHAENVGPAFAETARSIHDGETEARSIFGTASPDEISALREDGIEALPLPLLPEERN